MLWTLLFEAIEKQTHFPVWKQRLIFCGSLVAAALIYAGYYEVTNNETQIQNQMATPVVVDSQSF